MEKLVVKMDDVFDTGFTLEEYADMWLDEISDDLYRNQGADNTEEQIGLVLRAITQRFNEKRNGVTK